MEFSVFHEIEILLVFILAVSIASLIVIGLVFSSTQKELKQINIRLAQSVEWSRYLAGTLETRQKKTGKEEAEG